MRKRVAWNKGIIGRFVKSLVGQRFGRLVVLEYAGVYRSPKGVACSQWKCQCDCGNIKVIQGSALKSGSVVSCKCLNNENAKQLGLSNKGKSNPLTTGKYNGMYGKREEKNHGWKGDNVGYRALHTWVKKKLGKAKRCVNSPLHKARRYYWGNISGEYKRDLSDWHELCPHCNVKDGIHVPERIKEKRRRKTHGLAAAA